MCRLYSRRDAKMRASHVAQHLCCLHKSSRVSGEKSASSKRFICHGIEAGVDGLNASKLESELVDPSRLERHLVPDTSRWPKRAMHQQFTTALEGLTRRNAGLENELTQSRQQAANELAALRQEVRGSPLRGTQATGVRVELLEQCVHGYAGAAIPRLQKLMEDGAKAAAPIPNATTVQHRHSSTGYRVPGGRQRRSRGLSKADREVRAKDENTFCRTTDVHLVLLTSR